MIPWQQPFISYPGLVWSTCYQSLAWLDSLVSGASSPAAVANPALVVYETLLNGIDAIDAWRAGAVLNAETINLAQVEALPLMLDPTTSFYFLTRVASLNAAASAISALPTTANPFAATGLLTGGAPAIASPKYLEWCLGFQAETAPSGMVATTLPTYASAAASAWLTVTQAVGVVQGTNPTAAYDTAARMYRCSALVATMLSQFQSLPFQQGTFSPSGWAATAWNGVVALPAILSDAASLGASPYTLSAQQAIAVRYALGTISTQVGFFLSTLGATVSTPPSTARLLNNDTLIDLASRQLGDPSQWKAIAAANAINPPYPGPTNQAIAMSGTQLFMPGGGQQPSAAGTPPSYPNDAMGVDWWLGPINGAQPTWNGDVATIGGFANLAQALGRRIQTPLGALVYHPDYGSRIPGEVGAIQSVDEAARLAAFGRATLAADKRTGRVVSAIAATIPGQQATFSGVVLPVGPGGIPVDVQATILPP